jgi:hypothetical protein
MGHVLFRLRQRRAAAQGTLAGTRLLVISAVAGLAFLAYAGAGQASVCDTSTGTCTATPVAGESAQISQTPGMTTTGWSGMPYADGVGFGNPQDCGSWNDPSTAGNATCDHFELTPRDPGQVRVTVTWGDPADLFQVIVCLVPPTGSVQFSTDDCAGPAAEAPGPGGLDGTVVAENQNTTGDGFETLVFAPQPGTTYEIRVRPVLITNGMGLTDAANGCAGYTTSGACAPPSVGGTPTSPTSDCPATMPGPASPMEPATTMERRISGTGDTTDGSGNVKNHFSFHAEQENDPTVKGQVAFKDDGVLKFKSRSITCASFFDEGYDSQGDPLGSAEIRGVGTLRMDDGTKNDNKCFRVFARDAGDHPSGNDQFSIEFTDPAADNKCYFTEPPPGDTSPPIAKGNIEYQLNA